MSANKPFVLAIFGGTGSGKSLTVKTLLETTKERRILIWDNMGEYAKFGQVITSPSALLPAIQAAGKNFSLIFHPKPWGTSPKQRRDSLVELFDWWCMLAYKTGNCLVVAEELKQVTQANSAPEWWGTLSSAGRHRGCKLVGTSQRPASVDKDFFGNATRIRTGRLPYPPDRRTVAEAMEIPHEDIAALGERQFIERDTLTGRIFTGTIEIPKKISRGTARSRSGTAPAP
jgi:hypothetical protein